MVEQALTLPPDLILMDIGLPGIDGYDALRQLRADPLTHDIPVVAFSADAMTDDVLNGMAAGFDDYLTKPVKIPVLLALPDRIAQRAHG